MELVIVATIIFLCITLIICTVILVHTVKQLYPEVQIPTMPQIFNRGTPDNVSGQHDYHSEVPLESFTPNFKKEVKVEFEDKYNAKDNR